MSSYVDLLTIGETMALLTPEPSGPASYAASFRHRIAGAESNVAIAATRLGLSVRFLSAVGDDAFGESIVRTLRGEGVDVSTVRTIADAPTGVMVREPGLGSDPVVHHHRTGSAASRLDANHLDGIDFRSLGAVFVSGITPALSDSCRSMVFSAVERASTAGVTVVFDPNVRRKLWPDAEVMKRIMIDLANRADIVLAGEDEATLLTGQTDAVDAALALLEGSTSLVVVKRGTEGSLGLTRSHSAECPAVTSPGVVDPMGAGDAWAGALLSVLLESEDPAKPDSDLLARGLRRANLVGSLATTFHGDWESLPRLAEIIQIEQGAGS